MMKYFPILVIGLLCIIPGAMATNAVNTSLATIEDPWYGGENLTAIGNVSSPSAVCGAYGLQDRGPTFQWWADGRSPYTPWGMVSNSQFDSVSLIPMTQVYYNVPVIPSLGALTMAPYVRCVDDQFYTLELHPYYNSSAYIPAPVANFTASSTNATAPSYIAFTDTSLYEFGACTYNWSFSPTNGVLTSPSDLVKQDITMYFTETGNFTISHGVSCDAGSNISTKTDYIKILNQSLFTNTSFRTISLSNGIPITNSSINMKDMENGSWVNVSSTDAGMASILTLTGHHVSAYASAFGYSDADLLNQAAGGSYSIMMSPTGHTNVSSGNVTLFVTVTEFPGHGPITGADVGISFSPGNTGTGSTILHGTTGTGGIVSFVVPNKTTVIIEARADSQGFLPASSAIGTGTGNGGSSSVATEVMLHKNTVTPTTAVTTLPGGGTPTPTVTILPGCEDPNSDLCHQSKSNSLMDVLRDNGLMIMELCILVIIFGLLGMLMKFGR